MSDQLLVVLRIGLLVLVYLVFFRVLRAVWSELRAGSRTRPAPTPDTPAREHARPAAPAHPVDVATSIATLRIVEPRDQAGARYTLDTETTIGRAVGCRICIDDTHVSKVHARVFSHDDRWFVEDLGSTNGTMLNDVMIGGAEPIGPGDRIRVGETLMELA